MLYVFFLFIDLFTSSFSFHLFIYIFIYLYIYLLCLIRQFLVRLSFPPLQYSHDASASLLRAHRRPVFRGLLAMMRSAVGVLAPWRSCL